MVTRLALGNAMTLTLYGLFLSTHLSGYLGYLVSVETNCLCYETNVVAMTALIVNAFRHTCVHYPSFTEEHTPIAVSVEMPVAVVTEGTPNLATYYTELSGQRLISTLSTSPLSPLTPFITSHHHNGMNNNS